MKYEFLPDSPYANGDWEGSSRMPAEVRPCSVTLGQVEAKLSPDNPLVLVLGPSGSEPELLYLKPEEAVALRDFTTTGYFYPSQEPNFQAIDHLLFPYSDEYGLTYDSFLPEKPNRLIRTRVKLDDGSWYDPAPCGKDQEITDNELHLQNPKDAAFRDYGADLALPRLSRWQEVKLSRAWTQNHSQDAKEMLIRHNIGLVFDLTNKFQNRGEPYSEVIHTGMVGLINAANLYKPELGNAFSTYASYCIYGEMNRGVRSLFNGIKLPLEVYLDYRVMWGFIQKEFPDFNKMELSGEIVDKLSAIFGWDKAKANEMVQLFEEGCFIELDRPLGDDNSATLEDMLEDPLGMQDFHQVAWVDFLRMLFDNSKLPPRTLEIIMRHLGLNGNEPQTLKQIGESMGGLTRERIRQIEKNGLVRFCEMLMHR